MNTIILKHSETPGKIPSTDDLVLGELAVNTVDGSIFLKTTEGKIVEFVPAVNANWNKLSFYLYTASCVGWFVITVAILTHITLKGL